MKHLTKTPRAVEPVLAELIQRVRDLSTEEFAHLMRVQAQTVRASLCRKGHYCGIRPRKLPNRLLVWPRDAVERLLEGEAA